MKQLLLVLSILVTVSRGTIALDQNSSIPTYSRFLSSISKNDNSQSIIKKRGSLNKNQVFNNSNDNSEINLEDLKLQVKGKLSSLYSCSPKNFPTKKMITLKLSWDITEKGTVKYLSIDSSNISDRQFKECIVKKVNAWIFKKPSGGQSIAMKFPFVWETKQYAAQKKI